MDPRDSSVLPELPAATPPFALRYSELRSSRPATVTVIAVIGIVMAVLGFLTAAFGTLSAVMSVYMGSTIPAMRWQTPGALAVSLSDAAIGAVLAAMLMSGSIGLLKLRAWSRRLLLWWAWVYLLSVAVFLLLQILIVVPSQAAMLSNILASTPARVPITVPAGSTQPTTMTYNYYVPAPGVATPTAAFAPAPAGPPPAQVAAFMKMGYVIMAVGKSVVAIIFPIVLLIVMQLNSVRIAIGPGANLHSATSEAPIP